MKRAFTLIELLVVIAIISILAAIMFPTFVQAKSAAKQVVCMSNMRQVSLAVDMYVSDCDGIYPPATVPSDLGNGFAPQQVWIGYDNNNAPMIGGLYGLVNEPAAHPARPGAIDPYLNNQQVKRCPEMPRSWQTALAMNWFNPGFDSDYYVSHPSARGQEFGPSSKTYSVWSDGQIVDTAAAEGEIEEPSTTLLIWEHDARVPLCNFLQARDWFDSPPNDQYLRDHFRFLHHGGVMTLWVDGHTRWMRYEQLRRPMFSCRKDIYR